MKRFLPYLTLLLAFAVVALGVWPPARDARAASDQGFNGFTAKTADYTITAAENGTTFTNRGASGAVVLTLPAVAANLHYRVIVIAAQTVTVAAPTADTLIGYNDLDLDSLASNTVGAVMDFHCDGTSWIGQGCQVGVTYTLND